MQLKVYCCAVVEGIPVPYIIDGHNLIPKIPGLSLQDIDDELQLVNMLQEFCRVNRKRVEVYFDNAPTGSTGARNYGLVIARFIRQGVTADEAIRKKLVRLGGEARNWTVVSSDHEVQVNARAARAKILPAEAFAEQLLALTDESGESRIDEDSELSAQDVEDWMMIFGFEDQDDDF
ncbi:MAG: NYN domain-containing protein [Anaerolineales bacterium]